MSTFKFNADDVTTIRFQGVSGVCEDQMVVGPKAAEDILLTAQGDTVVISGQMFVEGKIVVDGSPVINGVTKFGKNLIGTFFQPDLVISDINILKSLPKREIICGYAEILKHSIIKDKKNFNFINNNKFKIFNLESKILKKTIFESCKIKRFIVQKDEKENN